MSMLEKENTELQNQKKQISPIFLSNKISSTLIIPIKLAQKFHLNEPNTHVVLEERDEGILIKKLVID